MPETTYSLGPLFAEIRAELRDWRASRAARRVLRRDLAWATSPGDFAELDAILERYAEAETADVRDVLAERRAASQERAAAIPGVTAGVR
jgi:hypothetical protein